MFTSIFCSLHQWQLYHAVFSVSLLSSENILKAMSLMYSTFPASNIPFPNFPLTLHINLSVNENILRWIFTARYIWDCTCNHGVLQGIWWMSQYAVWLAEKYKPRKKWLVDHCMVLTVIVPKAVFYIIHTCESLLTSREFIILNKVTRHAHVLLKPCGAHIYVLLVHT